MIISVFVSAIALLSLSDWAEAFHKISVPEELRVSAQAFWDHYTYCTVSPSGDRVVILLPKQGAVMAFDFDHGFEVQTLDPQFGQYQQSHYSIADIESFDPARRVQAVATSGRRPDQVQVPLAVRHARTGGLFVSDNAARRIAIYDPQLELEGSFLLSGLVAVPNDIHLLPDSTILAVGLNLDPTSSQPNVGDFCTVLDQNGAQLSSFAYSPEIVFENGIWAGVEAIADIDERGRIFLVFNVEGAIRIYDRQLSLVRMLEYRPAWFSPPDPLEPPRPGLQSLPPGFKTSWPRIVKVLHLPGDNLLIAAETNDLIADVSTRFVFDIVDLSEDSCLATIATDYLPVDVDNQGNLYLISITGDELLRIQLAGRRKK